MGKWQFLCFLHAPTNREMHYFQRMRIQEERLILYGWLPLDRILQQGPFPHPSTQGEDSGPYCPKAHDQRNQNYCRGHRGRPDPMPVHSPDRYSPRQDVILAPVPSVGKRWTALLSGAGAAPTAHALTKTVAPNSTTPTAVRSVKKSKQCTTNRRS